MVGTQEHLSFLAEGRILRGREGMNLLVHAYRPHSLSFFSPSFLIFLFFLIFFFSFLNSCFYFLVFKFSNTVVLTVVVVVPVHDKGLLIVLALIGFYYFSP